MAKQALLDRLLAGGGARRFAAVAGPQGVHMVEYGRDRGTVALKAGILQTAPGTDADSLAAALVAALTGLGAQGGELSLALSGFGTAHHILTLPEADPEILRPIVRRELLRYYPDLDDPEVDFALGPEVEGAASPNREILVGAVPRRTGTRLSRALAEEGVVLRQLTVMPQVLQSLYDAFDGKDSPAVMVLVMESGALIGCFNRGALRLFIEPPQDVHGRPVRNPAAVTEQVERANLFLRQQFPNAPGGRVLLAAPAGEYEALETALEERVAARVSRLSEIPAGSLAALGAALAAEEASSLQLLPQEVRPRTPAERLTRRLAVTAGTLVALAAVWWAGAGMRVARVEAERAGEVERQVSAVLPAVNRTGEVLEERRAHELRLKFLEETAATGTEVRRVLAGLASETRAAVELERLTVERSREGWLVELAGRAEARGSAEAVRAIDALYRGIPERLPVAEAEFGGMQSAAEGGGAPVAIAFDMSFIVLWQSDLPR